MLTVEKNSLIGNIPGTARRGGGCVRLRQAATTSMHKRHPEGQRVC